MKKQTLKSIKSKTTGKLTIMLLAIMLFTINPFPKHADGQPPARLPGVRRRRPLSSAGHDGDDGPRSPSLSLPQADPSQSGSRPVHRSRDESLHRLLSLRALSSMRTRPCPTATLRSVPIIRTSNAVPSAVALIRSVRTRKGRDLSGCTSNHACPFSSLTSRRSTE